MRRILTVILASDVAGYSRLVAQREEDTIRRFREASAVFSDLVKKYQGTVFNTAGDAILAKFDSAVDATRCALDIQDANNANNAPFADQHKLLFRIGIAIGDVLVAENGDLLGDAVNVAARLEGLAEPGGICISDDVRAHVLNKIRVSVVDLGDQSLRNIPRAVRAYRLVSHHHGISAPLHDLGRKLAIPGPLASLMAAAAVACMLILALLTWYPMSRQPNPTGPGWSSWEDQDGYQREFERQLRKRWYPRMLEAQLFGDVVKYRGHFEPFPSNNFDFYSRHSLNDEEFRAADAQYIQADYKRIYQQRIVVGTRPFNQGTWTKP